MAKKDALVGIDNWESESIFRPLGIIMPASCSYTSSPCCRPTSQGNVLALRNGDIGYVDFGNVAEISRMNQECLIDSVVHAMNDDYVGLAGDMQNLGFLSPGTDVVPIADALRSTWAESLSEAGLANFSFRTLTDQFNKLLYRYPIRVPERFSLIIRALLTQVRKLSPLPWDNNSHGPSHCMCERENSRGLAVAFG